MLACHREKVADGILGNVQNLAIAVTYTFRRLLSTHILPDVSQVQEAVPARQTAGYVVVR
jgi:hypothetical protein